MTKKKLPTEHPQKRQVKRKPRARKIVNTLDRGVCVDFYGDTWATTMRPDSWMPARPREPNRAWRWVRQTMTDALYWLSHALARLGYRIAP